MERNEGFRVQQTNIVVDVLGGYDRKMRNDLNSLLGKFKTNKVSISIQTTILLHAIKNMNIALSYWITLRYAVFVCLSLYTHRYPIKGESSLALGPSVEPKIKHVTNY